MRSGVGDNVDKLAAVYPELHITRSQIDAMQATRAGALIGRTQPSSGWKVGDKIPVGTTLWTDQEGRNSWTFDIVGIFDPDPKYARTSLGSGFWINYGYWDEARRMDRHHVHQFIAQIDNPAQATAIAADIDRLFANSSDETRTQTENAAIQFRRLPDVELHRQCDCRRSDVRAAVLDRQYDDAVGARTDSGAGRTQDPRILRRHGLRSGGGRIPFVMPVRRRRGPAAVLGGDQERRGGTGGRVLPLGVIAGGLAIAVILAVVSGLPPAVRALRLNIVDALAGR